MDNDQVEAIEKQLQAARVVVEFGNALARLKSNRDFKEVVLKGYFETEAIRLVHLKASPHMQSAESQASIVSQMDAIGSFSAYLNAGLAKASMASRAMEDSEAALADINNEPVTE